jgi:hypothetical protein
MLDTAGSDDAPWAPDAPRPEPSAPAGAGSRRRMWIALGGVGALVAIIVGANVLAEPDEPRRAAPATSTSAPSPSSAPVAASTSPPGPADSGGSAPNRASIAAPIIVADAPSGYSVQQADRYQDAPIATTGQLWTTWAADALSATWVAITAWPDDQDWSATGTTRVWLSNGVGVLSRRDDGTTVLEAGREGHHITLQANGVAPPALASVMDSLHVEGGRIARSSALDALGLRLVVDAAGDLPPSPQPPSPAESSTISFVADDGQAGAIDVIVGRPLNVFDRAMRTFLLREPVSMVVGAGHLATLGVDGRYGDASQLLAIVDVDGTEVELSGAATAKRELLAVARSLRVGTEDDWTGLVAAASSSEPPADAATDVAVAAGAMRTGTTWRASVVLGGGWPSFVQVTMTPVQAGSGPTTFGGGVVGPGADDVIQPIASRDGVVLVAQTARDHPGTELRVTVADGTYHVAMTDPAPSAPGLFGALGFSELAAYHAELVGADGTVLATLDGT